MRQQTRLLSVLIVFTILFASARCEEDTELVENYIDVWDVVNYPLRGQVSEFISSVAEDKSIDITPACRNDLKLFAREINERTDRAMTMHRFPR